MELGNVYEVFQIGDIVKVKDITSFYCGEIGIIVRIEETGCYTEPIYTIRVDRPDLQAFDNPNKRLEIRINAKSLVKVGHIKHDEETITMGERSGKAMKKLQEALKEASDLDAVIYSFDFLNKLTGDTDEMKKIDVKKIIFSGPKTIVLWTDDTKTIVSINCNEVGFDPEDAFRAAYTKKMFGTNSKIKRIIKEKSNIEEYQKAKFERLGQKTNEVYNNFNEALSDLPETEKKRWDEIQKLNKEFVADHFDIFQGFGIKFNFD